MGLFSRDNGEAGLKYMKKHHVCTFLTTLNKSLRNSDATVMLKLMLQVAHATKQLGAI